MASPFSLEHRLVVAELQAELLVGEVEEDVDPLFRGGTAEDQLLILDDHILVVPHGQSGEGTADAGEGGQVAAQALVPLLHVGKLQAGP